MTVDDIAMDEMINAAKELGKKRQELEKRNARRIAKGRPPLPDDQEKADKDVHRIRNKTGKAATVDGETALKLFEQRRAAMLDGEDDDDIGERDDLEQNGETAQDSDVAKAQANSDESMKRAQKEAAAARRVADMKNGRIDHDGVWGDGQKLEGGDDTRLPHSPSSMSKPENTEKQASLVHAWEDSANHVTESTGSTKAQEDPKAPKNHAKAKTNARALTVDEFLEFQKDLYYRLKESFGGLEQTLSDLQGRVLEMAPVSMAPALAERQAERQAGEKEFAQLLDKRVPVVFNVGGTRMSFDAITVFHASPCITVVTKIGSATITPKPGATLKLSYDMDGVKYENDPVTYLGTRFELPMFGLAFIGFIRDLEASQLDVDAGIGSQEGQPN